MTGNVRGWDNGTCGWDPTPDGGLGDIGGWRSHPCPDPGQEPLDAESQKIKDALDDMLHPDPSNRPYYDAEGFSAIDVILAYARQNFLRGTALKYLLRAGKKGDAVNDLRKAIWYIEREIAISTK